MKKKQSLCSTDPTPIPLNLYKKRHYTQNKYYIDKSFMHDKVNTLII